jgi:hypothetical protein
LHATGVAEKFGEEGLMESSSVEEMSDLPGDLPVDNLRMNQSLPRTIEEAWMF